MTDKELLEKAAKAGGVCSETKSYCIRYLRDDYTLADAFRPEPHWGSKSRTVDAAGLEDHTADELILAAEKSSPDGYWLHSIEAIGGKPLVRDVFRRAVPFRAAAALADGSE